MANSAGSSHEPWFVRFHRELVHHHKSALSNPAQFLRILTGQEALHHPFTLVPSKIRKSRVEGRTAASEVNKGSTKTGRIERICERLSKEREERAVVKGIFAALPLLECCQDPKAVDRLLLDTLLGTGRVVDDLRSLTNLVRGPITAHERQEALKEAVLRLSSAICGMRPLKLALSQEDVGNLCAQLRCSQDVTKAVRRWIRTLNGDAHGRHALHYLVSEPTSLHIAFGTYSAFEPEDLVLQLQSAGPWVAELGARTRRAYCAAELRTLASRLLLLCDLARRFGACSSSFRVDEAQTLACQILHEVLRGENAEGKGGLSVVEKGSLRFLHAEDAHGWGSLSALQMRFLGDQLQLAPRRADSRVPWPPDRWQRELLDAIDERVGVLVSAPTSAGKTFAAYYAMERVLRASNTDAVLFVAPTEALAAQVEAEVHARFSQKPYPHDGHALCAKWGDRLASKAQVILLLAHESEEFLNDDGVWERLRWVICDEIHMQPLQGLKALSRRCGRASVPFLAMSATVQNPHRMRERLAEATKCSRFRLICHSERMVDLRSFRWDVSQGSLHALHPLLVLDSEAMKHTTIPHMAPADALLAWESLRAVIPVTAHGLEPQAFLENRRLGPLAKQLPLCLCVRQVRCTVAEFLNKPALMLREEFRAWERHVARCVQSLDDSTYAGFLSILAKKANPIIAGTPFACDIHPMQLARLLRTLKQEKQLPCLCFHGSTQRVEILLLGLSEYLESGAKQQLKDTAEGRAQGYAQQKAAWHQKHQKLQTQLEEARTRARGVLNNEAEVANEERQQQRVAELQVNRLHNAEQARIAKNGRLMEMKSKHHGAEEAVDALLQTIHKAQNIELLRVCFAAWPFTSARENGRRSDMWGYEADTHEHSHNVFRKVRDVEGDRSVRAARAALEAHEECGQPALQEGLVCSDYSFEALRPQHMYKTEIVMLLEHAERELHNLGRRRGNMLWAQSMICALRRGVTMHFSEEKAEALNFAVQLLFRIGHVQVLLADEALSCGINLPCRTVVMLDSQIKGTLHTQMAGRAGRRGLDLFGATVYVQDLEIIRRMHAEN